MYMYLNISIVTGILFQDYSDLEKLGGLDSLSELSVISNPVSIVGHYASCAYMYSYFRFHVVCNIVHC